jgi:hypothetical protein
MPRHGTLLLAALLLATPGAAAACLAGAPAPCPPRLQGDPGAPVAPLTREDLNARIGLPGPPIVDAVRRDVKRSWEAVRRRPPPLAIAHPPGRPHVRAKGEMP